MQHAKRQTSITGNQKIDLRTDRYLSYTCANHLETCDEESRITLKYVRDLCSFLKNGSLNEIDCYLGCWNRRSGRPRHLTVVKYKFPNCRRRHIVVRIISATVSTSSIHARRLIRQEIYGQVG
jgi:hypothetical protein